STARPQSDVSVNAEGASPAASPGASPPAISPAQPVSAPTLPASTQPTLPAEPVRSEILRPEVNAPRSPAIPTPPRYTGPSGGTLIWSGTLDKNQSITIDGTTVTGGSLRGDFFPGVPVQLEVQPADVGIAEPPSPSNGFRRLVIRSRSKRNILVTI